MAKYHPLAAKTGQLTVESTRVLFYNSGLLQGITAPTRLAYEVMVRGKGSEPIREQIILDANTGAVLNRIDRIETVLNRITYAGTYKGPVIHQEGNPLGTVPVTDPPFQPGYADPDSTPPSAVDAATYTASQRLHIYAGGTWKMYKNMLGRDGYNQDGPKPIPATGMVQESVLLANQNCPNAYWDGTSANYCPGFDLDDVVSHEWSHAYTEYTDGLVYQYQSGALNEGYSDIFGETYDLINGFDGAAGQSLTEGQYYKNGGSRWYVGEDLSDGAASLLLRDMWDPDDFPSPSPGKVSSANYECTTADNGGVHTNSGVPNHAYAMLVDGRPNSRDPSTFNGIAVPKIGMIKAAHIYFWAKTHYQTPTTNFTQHADALDASCQDLKGVNLKDYFGANSGQIITESDCTAVKTVARAVEYRTNVKVQCNYTPVLLPEAGTPALCPTGQAPKKFFSEGFNAATFPTTWVKGMRFGNTGNTAIANWTLSTALPAPHTGSAAFFKNDKGGDCSAADHSAAYWMESPAITVPNATSKLVFTHFMQSESLFDGGNLKYAINGSTTWTIVPPAAMAPATGGYNPHSGTFDAATPVGQNTSPNAGQAAWTGSDQGEATGSWGTTIVNFAQFAAATRPAAGSTIKFRYEFANDGCNGNLGWFVDQVDAFFCAANTAPTASFSSITPANGEAPLAVSFVVAGTDPDAGDSVVSYTLDFGDGSTPVTQNTTSFSHTYTTSGQYTPKLTVSDSFSTKSAEVSGAVIDVTKAAQGTLTPFTFIDRTNVRQNTFITSEVVTVTGFTGTLDIIISGGGGQYRINNGPFTSAKGVVLPGDKITVRHISSTAEGTAVTSSLSVGDYSTPFKSTTTVLDRVPDPFGYATQTGLEYGKVVASNVLTLTGFDAGSPIYAGPGLSYRINGGAYTTARGTLNPGDTLQVQHTSSTEKLGYTKSYIKVGGVTGNFVTRSK